MPNNRSITYVSTCNFFLRSLVLYYKECRHCSYQTLAHWVRLCLVKARLRTLLNHLAYTIFTVNRYWYTKHFYSVWPSFSFHIIKEVSKHGQTGGPRLPLISVFVLRHSTCSQIQDIASPWYRHAGHCKVVVQRWHTVISIFMPCHAFNLRFLLSAWRKWIEFGYYHFRYTECQNRQMQANYGVW